MFLISSSIVLRHVLFGLHLLLYPWGFQSSAVFCFAPASLRNVCPIQFHFLPFIWIFIGFCLVILHIYSFVILSVHFIFNIRVKHLFINVCNLLFIWLVVLQVSQAYNNTDFSFEVNIRILTPFDMYGSITQEVNLNLCSLTFHYQLMHLLIKTLSQFTFKTTHVKMSVMRT